MIAGVGPQPAIGMIVGEAPTLRDDENGIPFSDRWNSRQLGIALKALGLDRDDLYLTYVVKEVPMTDAGQVRRPTLSEIDQWKGILNMEIAATKPKAILALGTVASDVLLEEQFGVVGNVPVGSKVGHVYTAWHPAAIRTRLIWNSRWAEWLNQLEPWALAL